MFNETETRKTMVSTRIPAHLKQRWQSAAALRGLTLTDFMIFAVNNATDAVFEAENNLSLSERDQRKLSEMLSRPPRPNERLHTAIREQLEQMQF